MKREIKFRLWDSKNHKWFIKGENGLVENMVCCDSWDMFDPDDYVWCQYTGLHDKNGREIYEGDIVKYHMVRSYGDHYDPVTLGFIGTDWDVDADIIGKVSIWPSNGVMMTNIITDDPDMFCKKYPVPKRWHVTHDCEVIGNIFEDKQLLDGKQ